MTKKNNEKEWRLPPYVSFKTFKGFIQKLKDTVVPPQIDSSVLRSYAGGVARKLTAALKFLGLIEESGGGTTEKLVRLVKTYDTSEWSAVLSTILFDAYKDLVGDLSLEVATPTMLDEKFRTWGADGTTLQACVAFYVAAAREAGITLSPLIIIRPRGRPVSSGRPRKRQDDGDDREPAEAALGAAPSQPGTVRFAFPIPDKPPVTLFLPADVSDKDWEMVNAMVSAYIKRREKG